MYAIMFPFAACISPKPSVVIVTMEKYNDLKNNSNDSMLTNFSGLFPKSCINEGNLRYINEKNIEEISIAGADAFVAGSAIFGTQDYKKAISLLK